MARLLAVMASMLLLLACGDDSNSDGTGGAGGTGAGGSGAGGSGAGGSGASGGGDGGSLPDGRCRVEEDCDGSFDDYCAPPGAILPCGTCYTPMTPCQSDDECTDQGDHYICEIPGCACDSTKECREGCLDGQSCGPAQVCGADHRCAAQPCSAQESCPDNHECNGGTSTCTRRSCSSDADCEGFCVLDRCYEELGRCELPAG